MRWLHHVVPRAHFDAASSADYAPPSLAREGFVHTSFRDQVAETVRLHFAGVPREALVALSIDPRRLPAAVELAPSPRGDMPHVHGPIPRDAIRAVRDLAAFDAEAPDRVTGTRFGFVAFEGMTLLDLVGVHDPLSRIRTMGFDPTSTCEVFGTDTHEVWADGGVRVTVERVRPPLDAFDVLVVPGGRGAAEHAEDPAITRWLASFPPNRLVASVCTGALLLGAAGRLAGLRATTHASAMGALARWGARAVDARVVDEGQVVTGAGVTSGIDLGLTLVRRLEGEDVAQQIAKQMEWPR
ncbi:DUF952 domain-containing protein [Myxococcota bacterium]|nr:DUF952 domain-containing protein [Myxococcota bacterium]